MSYEGSREWLCANGHYFIGSCWDAELSKCLRCDAPITHAHSIDHTNGYEMDDPTTQPAPKEQIGTEDDWHVDHHGNRYAVAVPRYRPLTEWQAISPSKREDDFP